MDSRKMTIEDTLSIQSTVYLILVLIISRKVIVTADTNVYPSEYAYRSDSVYRSERSSASCRRYASGLNAYAYTEQYHHCDGTQLRLTDSDFGSEQYSPRDYYVWLAGSSASQLLFIFPTRVNLTTITLHYYSDNFRGLARLRFYAVPHDFDVWDIPPVSYSHVDIAAIEPPDGNSAGRRNISVKVDLTTKKVLLYKHRNSLTFVASEVEFISCTRTTNAMEKSNSNNSVTDLKNTTDTTKSPNKTSESQTTPISTVLSTTTTIVPGSTKMPTATNLSSIATTTELIIGVALATSVILLLVVIATISFIFLWRKLAQRKVDYDSSYSTLCRGIQEMQSQSVHTYNKPYDQIQLSPSTGQAEFISRNETANTNNPPPQQTEYDIHPSVDKDKSKSAKLKITASTISSHKENINIPEQLTYAVVNKKKVNKSDKESGQCQSQNTAAQNQDVTEESAVEHRHQKKQSQDDLEADAKLVESLQDLYSVVKKKPKERSTKDDPPPIPPYTGEELYTAIKTVPKTNTAVGEEAAPRIPPHTIDELYTAVQKKPKASNSKDEEEAPPIPAHTVEELYTAVMKKSKVKIAEDEEEISSVPPHIMEEL